MVEPGSASSLMPPPPGTTIRHFIFDGQGWSVTNTAPLATMIYSSPMTAEGPNDVIVEYNQFLGGLLGMHSGGSGWSVDHNVFDGFTIDPVTFVGGAAVDFDNLVSRATNNTVSFNQITTTVPPGTFPPYVGQINMPFVGVFAAAQDGMVLTNNKISIALGPGATGATAGIVVSDFFSTTGADLTSINSVIINNDGRGSTYAVVITLDGLGGTGNTVNINSINELTTDVRNRSIRTLLECDSSGVCP